MVYMELWRSEVRCINLNTDIFESISNDEKIDLLKDKPLACCRSVQCCNAQFNDSFALNVSPEGLEGKLSLCKVEINTAD